MPDFQSIFDAETGERFYLNLETGETQWLLPEDQAEVDAENALRDKAAIEELIKEGVLPFKTIKAWKAGEMTTSEILAMANENRTDEEKKLSEEAQRHKAEKKARKAARKAARDARKGGK